MENINNKNKLHPTPLAGYIILLFRDFVNLFYLLCRGAFVPARTALSGTLLLWAFSLSRFPRVEGCLLCKQSMRHTTLRLSNFH